MIAPFPSKEKLLPFRDQQTIQSKPDFISRQVTNGEYYFLNLKPPARAELIVVCGGMEYCASNYCVERNRFHYFGLEFVASGNCKLILDGKVHHLRPGAVFCYGPNTSHKIESCGDEPLIKFFVDLKGTRVADLLWNPFFSAPGPVRIAQYRWIHDLFRQLQDSARKGGHQVQELCRLLVEVLLERVQQLSQPAADSHSPAYQTYERCRSHLNTHYLVIGSVNQLADQCNVSSAYLARLFKRFAKTSPSQLLLQQKMNHAAELLLKGKLMVKEVAFEVGFEDPYYFSRSFKQFFGVSPREFSHSLSRS